MDNYNDIVRNTSLTRVNGKLHTFEELIMYAKRYGGEAQQKWINALGQWCNERGERWNGESYNFEKELHGSLYPIYQELESDYWETVGYELR